ncbi:helix-turn-helix domain-containing protein [Paenibacillus algicola]|uniref:helix-turn-helix domain-containing protein n=1 Tax=Paenibacillus algicola TaxID=2565926 RepID=UPI001C302EE9|nr:AraC family transcriptional regulator [Paenibacillus algicola]
MPHTDLLIDVAEETEDEPHEHSDKYQLLIPLSGKVDSHFSAHCYSLKNGTASIKNPSVIHWHTIKEKAKSVIISWNREEFHNWCICSGYMDEIEFYEIQSINTTEFMKYINKWTVNYLNDNNNAEPETIQSEVFEVLSKLTTGSHEHKNCSLFSHVVLDQYIKQSVEYIHEHYTDNISLEMLMAVSKQSKYHFIRSFKKHTGYSPYNYLLQVRIRKAQELLKQKKLSIQEISEQLSFSSQSHFHRSFVNIIGITPSEYRKNYGP